MRVRAAIDTIFLVRMRILFSPLKTGMEDFTYQPQNPNVFFTGDGLVERGVEYTISFLNDMIIEGNQMFTVSVVNTTESIDFTIFDTTGKPYKYWSLAI